MEKKWNVVLSVICSALFITGCPPSGPTTDNSPPGFVQVTVQLEGPTPPNPRGTFDLTSTDVSRAGIASDLVIRLIATAGDPQSGIQKIEIDSELTWQCAFGRGSEIIGVVQNAPLAFTPISQPAQPVTPFQLNAVAAPIAQTGCAVSPTGKGPVNIRGFVRAVATNGAGLPATSKTFVFDYADVGIPR